MTERPILFTVESVQGMLAGVKSQTRRAINPQPQPPGTLTTGDWNWRVLGRDGMTHVFGWASECPYGVPGDRLWVREPYYIDEFFAADGVDDWGATFRYKADNSKRRIYQCDAPIDVGFWPGAKIREQGANLRSSMFMPRWASRIMLEVTGVRVERVQDISDNDALAEGCSADQDPYWRPSYNDPDSGGNPSARLSYQYVWDEINDKRKEGIYAWKKNPWVWVIEFARCK